MSGTVPKILFAGGITGFAYYMVMRPYWFPDPAKTPGVKNIEARFTAGGGTPTYQPGTATRRGDDKATEPLQTTRHGVDSEKFKRDINPQIDDEHIGSFPKKFYEIQYNNRKNK